MKTNQMLVNITLQFIFVTLLLSGCYTRIEKTKELYSELKLYNLKSGERITLEIDDVNDNSGNIYGELKNGETIKGEFFLDGPRYPRNQYHTMNRPNSSELLSDFVNKKVGDDDSNSKYSEKFIKESFPVLYGYSNSSNAIPIGSGIIATKNNFLIELVFYKINFQRRIGDGIAKDNNGDIYRAYLSSEYIYQ